MPASAGMTAFKNRGSVAAVAQSQQPMPPRLVVIGRRLVVAIKHVVGIELQRPGWRQRVAQAQVGGGVAAEAIEVAAVVETMSGGGDAEAHLPVVTDAAVDIP